MVIDQRFGRGAVLQEAINAALPAAFEAAVTEASVVPLGEPDVEVTRLEDGELIEFTAELDIRPEFTVADVTKLTATVEVVLPSRRRSPSASRCCSSASPPPAGGGPCGCRG